ncbi:hypothetical protein A3K63_03600 [Candidatus Micrarchaeota archaeon RBG_16_49_10]|nr:MAG: hypothetical protein A3K63_03600 [Candidatus Micrarchaeota archaeon RBG_16_49_10]
MKGKVTQKGKRIEIFFDGKFFRKEHVLIAAQEYTTSFWVLVDGSPEKIMAVLIPKESDSDLKLVEDEFYNYVFSVTKNLQLKR